MKRLDTLTATARSLHGDLVADLVADWVGERAARSPSTAETYCSHLGAYLAWCAEAGVDPVLVRRQEAARFVRWLTSERSPHTGRVRSGSAVCTALSACARWLEFAVECEARPETSRNPFTVVERPVVARRPRQVRLRPADVSGLVLAAREDHVLGGTLGKVVLGSLALVGVRPTDLCRLDEDQVLDDGHGGYELHLTVKRGKQLVRWMPPVVASDLYAYLQRGRRVPEDGGRALLVHPRLHRRLNRADVLALVKRCATRAGLPDPAGLTARDFRRFFITSTRAAGADPEDRQRAAGHASVRTTALYDDTAWSRERDPAIRLAALIEDYPAEELARPLAHATVAEPRATSKYECDCTPQWGKARVWLGPLGIDEFARIEVAPEPEPGVGVLDRPICPTCHAIYLGPFRVRSIPGDPDQALMQLCRDRLGEAHLYPAAVARRDERERGVP